MYFKTLLGLFFFFLSVNSVCAQDLESSKTLIIFSDTEAGKSDTQTAVIRNLGISAAQIEELRLLNFYGDTVFRSLQAFPQTILAKDSLVLQLVFDPIQNLLNKGYAILRMGDGRSPLRIELQAQGKYNSSYTTTKNLEGEALRRELAKIAAQGHFSLGYNGARDRMFMNIDNKRTNGQGASQNTLECPYTGRVISGYSNRSAAQNSPHNFNTEHTFPQSLFPTNDTMKSDLHHLYATDANSNSQRGNLPFGVLTNWTWSEGGSKRGANAFEPRDVHKGQAARSILYFGIRYMHNSGVSRTFIAGQEATLKDWHEKYPPTAREIRRNNDIAAAQGNRNPLVDYPQFLSRMTQIANTSKEPRWKSPVLIEDSLDLGSINAGEVVSYEYIFCNQGTDSLAISNVSISDPQITILKSPTVVEAGGCAAIKLLISGDGMNHATELKFDDNSNGTTSYTIPLIFSGNVAAKEIDEKDFRVFQNGNYLRVEFASGQYFSSAVCQIYDSSGRIVKIINAENGQTKVEINLNGLADSVYLIELINLQGTEYKRYIQRIILSEKN